MGSPAAILPMGQGRNSRPSPAGVPRSSECVQTPPSLWCGHPGCLRQNQPDHFRPSHPPNPPPPRSANPQPSTLNPQPSTLNPQPSTLNPQPSTLNPRPRTKNEEPRTKNQEPRTNPSPL